MTGQAPGLRLVDTITAADEAARDAALEELCHGADLAELLRACDELEQFRWESDNLYERVRALMFLHALHRYHIPAQPGLSPSGNIPYAGYDHLLNRRFEEAISSFLAAQQRDGANDSISSALAAAYHGVGFQTLANQVRRSVRSVAGNRWMFRIGHPADQPLRVRRELLARDASGELPTLREHTPVRMDLSHSGWSDIFFLGMDYPEGARVINVSVDLGVRGRDATVRPPIEASLRVIDEPILRLTSVDLGATADIQDLSEVFDFAKDYLGLLKAAVIAAGVVPPGIEGSGESLAELLATMTAPGHGLEITSHVRDIPKGSRLAVSTNLLASLIAVCMRATGQARDLQGPLAERDRRVAAARAILGEWLGGSGGGWQDSGGLWPGIKLISGQAARPDDPEYGISRGCLLPGHTILGDDDISGEARRRLQESLVLVHGGMAQDVGPVLEMVTERYLLRTADAWRCRKHAVALLDEILAALRSGDTDALAHATTTHFEQPVQGIIPWATNLFTETVIARTRERFGADFTGFCMLGGMAGGGMAFLFKPEARDAALDDFHEILQATKRELEHALPFAMDPVIYDFEINPHGSTCQLTTSSPGRPGARPEEAEQREASTEDLETLLRDNGFDRDLHERIRDDLRGGRIGLAQNRLSPQTTLEDVQPDDVIDAISELPDRARSVGEDALRRGEVAVVTLAAGAASRWTHGAGVVKALHPFCRLGGAHRSFLELHLRKTSRAARRAGAPIPHVFTTSMFTHGPIAAHLARHRDHGHTSGVVLSPGRAVGLRLVPTVRDLRFMWEELAQQVLDEQAEKVRRSLQAALIQWAEAAGEGSDYTDNLPAQCLHPVGHWFEVPNMLRNGVLADLLEQQPSLRHLLLHNIDTVGVDVDPALLGLHIERAAALTFEVIPRRLEDRGGGLARVDGRPRILEGLAMPREEDEFELSYYSTNTTWIDIDRLLAAMNLTREDLSDEQRVNAAVRELGDRLPTYITLKDVKKRWGHGQEDIFPVAQFEKLWGDMTSLTDVDCTFAVVPRRRGQQLKDPAQLDGWVIDGSADHVASLCDWE